MGWRWWCCWLFGHRWYRANGFVWPFRELGCERCGAYGRTTWGDVTVYPPKELPRARVVKP